MAGRKLKQTISHALDGSGAIVSLKKKEATVFLDGLPAAKALTEAPDDFDVKFHIPILDKYNLVPATLRTSFRGSLQRSSTDSVPWSG